VVVGVDRTLVMEVADKPMGFKEAGASSIVRVPYLIGATITMARIGSGNTQALY
jgi:hypothetical protein